MVKLFIDNLSMIHSLMLYWPCVFFCFDCYNRPKYLEYHITHLCLYLSFIIFIRLIDNIMFRYSQSLFLCFISHHRVLGPDIIKICTKQYLGITFPTFFTSILVWTLHTPCGPSFLNDLFSLTPPLRTLSFNLSFIELFN